MREVDGMSHLLPDACSYELSVPARLGTAAQELNPRKVQARTMVDRNGGSEQDNRDQPRG
jgi:hypothetical protein